MKKNSSLLLNKKNLSKTSITSLENNINTELNIKSKSKTNLFLEENNNNNNNEQKNMK